MTFSKMVLWVNFRVSTSHCSKGEQARIHLLIKMMLHSEPLLYSVEFVHCCSLVEMPFMKGVGLSFNCGFCHSFVYEDAKSNSPKTSNVSKKGSDRDDQQGGVLEAEGKRESVPASDGENSQSEIDGFIGLCLVGLSSAGQQPETVLQILANI